MAIRTDILVEVGNDGDVQSGRARFDPVLAELVAVTGVNGLDSVTQVVEQARESLKAPALAAHLLPSSTVILKGAERNKSVVAGAATQDLGARVTNITVA